MDDGQDDDFVDNAELEAARNEQSFLEGRILELQDIMRYHQIIQEDETPHEHVKIGDWVTVVEDGSDEEERYHLVGAAEADPAEGVFQRKPAGHRATWLQNQRHCQRQRAERRDRFRVVNFRINLNGLNDASCNKPVLKRALFYLLMVTVTRQTGSKHGRNRIDPRAATTG